MVALPLTALVDFLPILAVDLPNRFYLSSTN
jgi:hypothetical protein